MMHTIWLETETYLQLYALIIQDASLQLLENVYMYLAFFYTHSSLALLIVAIVIRIIILFIIVHFNGNPVTGHRHLGHEF